MWSCTRARWAMRISDELNRFEKGLCRVAGPFFCVKGKVFSGTGYGLPQPVTPVTGFAMTPLTRSAGGGGTHGSRPTERFVGADDPVRPGTITQYLVGQGPCALPGAEKTCRADVGIGPYGSVTRGAMGGRPQGSPLRRVTSSTGNGPMWGANRALPVAEEAR